jgi:hypothetical protein
VALERVVQLLQAPLRRTACLGLDSTRGDETHKDSDTGGRCAGGVHRGPARKGEMGNEGVAEHGTSFGAGDGGGHWLTKTCMSGGGCLGTRGAAAQ